MCPRCKTPFNAQTAAKPTVHQPEDHSRSEKASGKKDSARTAVTASLLAVLVLVFGGVLFMNWHRLVSVYYQYTDRRPVSPGEMVRPVIPAETPLSPVARDAARSAASPAHETPFLEDEETRAARDVYKRCAEAIRAGNMSQAKIYISRATLQEMEQSGQFEMAMGMITGMNIDEFQASRQGDSITFKQSQKQGDATMSMSFKMVKEDGQWKLGR